MHRGWFKHDFVFSYVQQRKAAFRMLGSASRDKEHSLQVLMGFCG